MASIAAVMIVRDEEEHLAACLDSLKKVCDEFVIVDTGSVDRTIEIASKYTNQIHQPSTPIYLVRRLFKSS